MAHRGEKFIAGAVKRPGRLRKALRLKTGQKVTAGAARALARRAQARGDRSLAAAARLGARLVTPKKRGGLRKNPPFPAPTLHNLNTLPAPLGERGGVIDSGGQESKAPIVG